MLGIEVLSTLNFEVNDKFIKINGYSIPRIFSNRVIASVTDILRINVDEVISVHTGNGEWYTVAAINIPVGDFERSKILEGDFEINLDENQLNLSQPIRTCDGHSLLHSLKTPELPELKGSLVGMLTFNGRSDAFPKILRASLRKMTSKNGAAILNLSHHKSNKPKRQFILTNELLESMTKNTLLNKKGILKMLKANQDCFANDDMDLGRIKEKVKIEMRDPTKDPPYCRPRPVPFHLREWVDKKLQDMVKAGLIQISKGSQNNSPIHIVKKAQPGKYRITVDYSSLNTQLKNDRWPIPNMKAIFEHVGDAKVFSGIDFKSGFWHLELTPESRGLTAFSSNGRQYEFRVLPMGLSCAPGIMQRCMMSIFSDFIFKFALIYLDDLLIYSQNEKEHFHHLSLVFKRLREHGLKINPEKSFFGIKEVDYLGYTVGNGMVKPQESKVKAILNMPVPTNKTECKSFCGAIGFYTTSLVGLQYILGPIHRISGSKTKFDWGPEQQEAFEKAKGLLVTHVSLALPVNDPAATIILTTDASSTGWSGVLAQLQKDGTEAPLGNRSGNFTGSSLNWPIREKELFALVDCAEAFYVHLMAVDFIWRTDNKALSTLANASLKVKPAKVKERLVGWMNFLSQFSFSTELKKGTDPSMALCDHMSRIIHDDRSRAHKSTCEDGDSSGKIEEVTDEKDAINAIAEKEEKEEPEEVEESDDTEMPETHLRMPFWVKHAMPVVDMGIAQQNDPHIVKRSGPYVKLAKFLRKKLKRKNIFRITEENIHEVMTLNGWKILVPESLERKVFEYHHLPIHNSHNKMIPEIQKTMFIPRLRKKLREYLNDCQLCVSVFKRKKKKLPGVKTSTPNHPFMCCAADLVGPLPLTLEGNKYVLTYMCQLTNWVEYRALPSKTAESTLKALDDIFQTVLPPLSLMTDNGREFINKHTEEYLSQLGVYHQRITPYHPESNGQIERMHGTFKEQFIFLEKSDKELTWDKELKNIALCLNLTRQASGYSPYQLVHGFIPYRPAFMAREYEPIDHEKFVAEETTWAKNNIARMTRIISDRFCQVEAEKLGRLNEHPKNHEQLKVGQKVLVYFPVNNCSKLFSSWKGVYIITEVLDLNSYVVTEIGQRCRKYIVGRNRIRTLGSPPENEKLIKEGELIEMPTHEKDSNETEKRPEGVQEPSKGADEIAVRDKSPKENKNLTGKSKENELIPEAKENKIITNPSFLTNDIPLGQSTHIDFDLPEEVEEKFNIKIDQPDIEIDEITEDRIRPKRATRRAAENKIKTWAAKGLV